MEKDIVIIGRECLSRRELLAALSLRYILMTTDVIADFCGCDKNCNVLIRHLSSDDMIAYADYLRNIPQISAVGYTDGTALFLCKMEGRPLVVIDSAMNRLCVNLGLPHLMLFGTRKDDSIQNDNFTDNIKLITPEPYESLKDFIKKERL